MTTPPPSPIAALVDLLAAKIVDDYLREIGAVNDDKKSTTSDPELAHTGTDGE